MLFVIKKNFTLRYQPKRYKIVIFILFLILMGGGLLVGGHYISRGIKTIDSFNKNEMTYSSALIAMKNNTEVTKERDRTSVV